MSKDLVIIGAGGFAREASLLVEEINRAVVDSKMWNLLGFIDEDRAKWGLNFRGYPVLGGWNALVDLSPEAEVICVIGEPAAKKNLVEKALKHKRSFATLIHPDVYISDDVSLKEGVLINRGTVLTTNISIGEHVSINPCCGIGHDSDIKAYTTLMWRVNISGAAVIEEGCLIGTGATILQTVKVDRNTTVGAGAVVTKDLPADCSAVGVPARVIKKMKSGGKAGT